MNQDFNKIFKTPKYTGVTLSLLSMFVLAAMFVVWQQFPKSQELVSETEISVICDKRLLAPAQKILASFMKECPYRVSIEFLETDQIMTLFHGLNATLPDVLICNEFDLQSSEKAALIYSEHIPFAFESAGAMDLKTPNFPFVCSIHKKAQKAHVAYSLGRYFSAPSRGQFFLAEAGFTGVDGDRWMLKPTISILVERAYEKEIRSMAKHFSEREGAKIDIVSKTPADANATINLIGKSNAKEYLPDLLIGFGSLGTENSIYSPISRQAGVGASVSYSAKSKKTALRFWKFLQNDT